jgi:type II secretory pathway component PulF
MIYALLRYVGWVHFDVPGLGWLTRRLDGAAVLDALCLTTRRQHPLPEALAALARHYPKAAIRTRLRRVLKDMERGADWIESLRRRGVIGRAETAVLGAAQRVGNLPWALAEMADSSRRRLGYRLHGLTHLLFPAVVLSFGLLVLFVVVGFFMPLVLLIEKLGRW